jgi:hypothetical protein
MNPTSFSPAAISRHALRPTVLAALCAIAVSACAAVSPRPSAVGANAAAAPDLLAPLRPLCGKAYAGRVVVDTPKSADDPFAGKTLVMHVRECGAKQIRIPFHVGDDRSRTWVISEHDGALRLKHDHRHRDGSADTLTQYGGDQRNGTPVGRYEFPADAYSQDMFRKLGREVSVPNVWAVEIDASRFVYELSRPGRLFRVEFDLTQPIPAPPPPWGG